MKEGDKVLYKDIEYTILLIENEVVHLINDNEGLAVLKTEL